MNALTPPSVPFAVAVDDGDSGRTRLRLKQIGWTTATVGVTAWFCSYGPIPGILAVAVAKHILVAILVMGVGLDQRIHEPD